MHNPLRNCELAAVRDEIMAGLAKYQSTTGVQAAYKLAAELFEYRAHPVNRSARHMAEQLQRLKDHGVSPWDILQRTAEVYACIEGSPPGRFENADVEAITLARSVLKLASMGRYRAEGHMLRTMGAHVREVLGVFAVAFVRRLEQDKVGRRARIKQSASFEEAKP